MKWQEDKEWSDKWLPQITEILRRVAIHTVSVRLASSEQDKSQATDMVVTTTGGTVATRIRRPTCHFRDWTIRSDRRTGTKTELAKLREGFARWYLYCWLGPDGTIGDHVLIDLERVRAGSMLDVPRKEQTGDGWQTSFISISVEELRAGNCLTVDNCQDSLPAPAASHDEDEITIWWAP